MVSNRERIFLRRERKDCTLSAKVAIVTDVPRGFPKRLQNICQRKFNGYDQRMHILFGLKIDIKAKKVVQKLRHLVICWKSLCG